MILFAFLIKDLITSYQWYFSERVEIFVIIYLYLFEKESNHSQSFWAQVIYPFLIFAISFPFTLSFIVPTNLEYFFSLTFKSFHPLPFSYCTPSLRALSACSISPCSDSFLDYWLDLLSFASEVFFYFHNPEFLMLNCLVVAGNRNLVLDFAELCQDLIILENFHFCFGLAKCFLEFIIFN